VKIPASKCTAGRTALATSVPVSVSKPFAIVGTERWDAERAEESRLAEGFRCSYSERRK
jgi:hypothetical protein